MRKKLSSLYLFWVNLLPPVSLKKAISIAGTRYPKVSRFDGKRYFMYRSDQLEENHPFWILQVEDHENPYLIRSSHIITISKITGAIVYDGDAGDEG